MPESPFNKVAGLESWNFEILDIFSNNFCIKHLWATAAVQYKPNWRYQGNPEPVFCLYLLEQYL